MGEMHNIGWFILAYVSFLFVGRIIDAVRPALGRTERRLSPASLSRLLAFAA